MDIKDIRNIVQMIEEDCKEANSILDRVDKNIKKLKKQIKVDKENEL